VCQKRHYYPIINGLPKMLLGGLRPSDSDFLERYRGMVPRGLLPMDDNSRERSESRQVQETFREKWALKDTIGVSDSSPYKTFMRRWMLSKYGWRDETRFNSSMRRRKLILDAGAGIGRETINLARAAKKSIVVGIELSDCAANARENVSSLKNAHIIQGDILRMPFRHESFDFVLSEGVLHHTPNTREAFAACCRVLKKDGEIAFYVYRRKGPAREFTDDLLREVMQRASTERKWQIAEKLTRLGRGLSELGAQIEVRDDIPELGIRKGRSDVHRFFYWNFLKCFWNDLLPFDENMIINFDWFAPEHAHRHTDTEVRTWCAGNNIDITWFHEEESGYSVRGTKTS